jgi:hypothetical protein
MCIFFCVITLVPLLCVHILPEVLCSGMFPNEISNHTKISNQRKKQLLRKCMFSFMQTFSVPTLLVGKHLKYFFLPIRKHRL